MNCLLDRICSRDLISFRTLTLICRGIWTRHTGASASSWY